MHDDLPHTQQRLNQAIERRLRSAVAELRAMAIAAVADWEPPDFVIDAAQEEAAFSFLRACADARAAVSGRPAAGALGDDDVPAKAGSKMRRWVESERLIALDRAIAAGHRAERLLRQRGLRPIVGLREGPGRGCPARADLTFRRRIAGQGAGR